jgi:hypothetical protein
MTGIRISHQQDGLVNFFSQSLAKNVNKTPKKSIKRQKVSPAHTLQTSPWDDFNSRFQKSALRPALITAG